MKKTLLIILLISLSGAYAACDFSPVSKDTVGFLAEIPSLDTKLSNCPVPLDSSSKLIFGNNQQVQLTITRADKSTSYVLFTITNGALSGLTSGAGKHGYEIVIAECDLNSVLGASDRAGAFIYMYLQGKAKIVPKGLWNLLKFASAKLLASGSLKKAAVPVESSCLKQNGDVCQHGGECVSKNCVGVGQGPPWTYKCSCDPFTFKTSCPAASQPAPSNPSSKKPAGEICQHGGECTTGNCVGVGQGPPWTYRCSCDAFKYVTGC
ncbi:MAG: hypothetical protein HGA85_07915 [Nanoarchaeota archaeon]|nr:hypothetical protein [Nanoarchaeota archaeon]